MKRLLLWGLFLTLGVVFAFAHGGEEFEVGEFAMGEKLVQDKVPCDKLSDEQREAIGEYYMEQMHPGELHEQMDEMMGGEGSASLTQAHINIAKSFYCGEHDAMPMNMMDMMMGRSGGMMGRGGMSGPGSMMDGIFSGNSDLFSLLYLLLLIAALVLIILWITKLWKGMKESGKRN